MTHHTDAELLPCPFCGTAAKTVNSYEDDDWRVECWNDECSGHGKRCQNRSDAVLAWNRRAPAAPVPQGWKLVPEESTEAMARAFRADDAPYYFVMTTIRCNDFAERWRAVIAAAPQPPEAAPVQFP